MPDTHVNSLGKNLALNLFVYNDANSLLGNIVDSPSFAVVTFVGHSFLNSAHSLDIYNITFLVDLHVCGQRNNSMFFKRPREHVAGAPLLSFVLVILANYWKMAVPAKRQDILYSLFCLFVCLGNLAVLNFKMAMLLELIVPFEKCVLCVPKNANCKEVCKT